MAANFVVLGTWPFSEACVQKCIDGLQAGQATVVDAVEMGVNVAEIDTSYGKHHVGCGGWQNEDGCLELDAAIMDGRQLKFGAVTALRGYKPAISVARRVMDTSRHAFLTGEGAAKFASAEGFEVCKDLGTPSSNKKSSADLDLLHQTGHDTLGLLALDSNTAQVCAGVSSSGMMAKAAGRVGDSALPGNGLYADAECGAACCTGDGDQILTHCPCYRVVHLMGQGLKPQAACEQTVQEIRKRMGSEAAFELGIIAVDKQGNYGGGNMGIDSWTDPVAGTKYPGFPYVVLTSAMDKPKVVCVPPLGKAV